MFQFLFSLFWNKSKIDSKTRAEREKPVQSTSGYVYTDYKAKMSDTERKKKSSQGR